MFKRLVVAASVSAVAVLGLGSASGASAGTPAQQSSVKIKSFQPKVSKPHIIDWDAPGKGIDWDAPSKGIDWDAPAPAAGADGGYTTQRIDWD